MADKKLTIVDQWERFWAKIDKTDGCWLWTGATNSGGYGSFMYAGRLCGAHRLMLVWFGRLVSPIHTGCRSKNVVLHSCDNPRCVNPQHLTMGTNSQNQREAYARNLRKPYLGSTHTNAKLTDAQVKEIRDLYDSGQMLQIPLAKKYGVSQRAISLVVRRETYTCS